MLAASSAGLEVTEYSPLFHQVCGGGLRSGEKPQVQYMVTRLLNLAEVPGAPDAADALAICHLSPPYVSHARTQRAVGR